VDRESPEVIEKEMQTTRESLTEKVSLLEQQVVGTLQSSTTAVQDTVESVKSAVQDTVESVTGSVKDSVSSLTDGLRDALDVKRQVRQNPWACVGGAAALGFITGMLVFRRESSMAAGMASTSAPYSPAPAYQPPVVPMRPSWLGELFDMAGQEVKKIAQDALTRGTAQLKQTVQEQVPKLIETAVSRVTEAATPRETTATEGYANGRSAYTGMRN
jgi:ElaB/YqjD/DUF883 family membrane-anchored ribosome-binding protein